MPTAFDKAFTTVVGIEGGYVNDPADSGGETCWGITIATARAAGYTGPMKNLPINVAKAIYQANYWDKLKLTQIAQRSETLALELFESGVNVGVNKVATWLQIGLNLLGASIAADGQIGPGTLSAFNSIQPRDLNTLLKLMNIQQGAHYIAIAQNNPTQRKFIRGWLTRVQL